MTHNKAERTLVLIKPDGLQRGLIGEILHRFERKGLKIVALKLMELNDTILDAHYAAHREKPFFARLKSFMMQAPVVAMVLEGIEAVSVVRVLTGETLGRKAAPGTIRGDFSISQGATIVHASDSAESSKREIDIFFKEDEIIDYVHGNFNFVYAEEERE
jgi:nucleoside-diphosphate kinase